MSIGAKFKVTLPAEWAYGRKGKGVNENGIEIPPNAALVYVIELFEIRDSWKLNEKKAEKPEEREKLEELEKKVEREKLEEQEKLKELEKKVKKSKEKLEEWF